MTTYKSLLKEVKTIKKQASQDFKEKLISLLESEDISSINQAIELNEALGILTDQEISDILLPMVIDGNDIFKEQWKQDGLGWFLLEKFPNHPMWNKLKDLYLDNNNLSSLPKEIGNLKNLGYLNLGDNYITSLPKEIGNLKNLEELILDGNNLKSLPKEIGNLKNLKVLHVKENYLASLPKEIGNLTNLKYFHAWENELASLPKEIGNLKNLEELVLDGNNLKSLPKEIGNLKNLEYLRLRSNDLTIEDVPPNLRSIPHIFSF